MAVEILLTFQQKKRKKLLLLYPGYLKKLKVQLNNVTMKQSIFKKEVFAIGSQGTVKAEIVATMNYSTLVIKGTHAGTHDDFVKNVPVHKVEVFINGRILEKVLEVSSENMLYSESERLIKIAQLHCQNLANSEPAKTFGDKMSELFS